MANHSVGMEKDLMGPHLPNPRSVTASDVCGRCSQPIENDQASMLTAAPQHVMCPPDPVKDRDGVDFGWNCLTRYTCKRQNLCFGTCKLF